MVIFDQHVINGHYNMTHMPVSDVLPTVKVAAPPLVLLWWPPEGAGGM